MSKNPESLAMQTRSHMNWKWTRERMESYLLTTFGFEASAWVMKKSIAGADEVAAWVSFVSLWLRFSVCPESHVLDEAFGNNGGGEFLFCGRHQFQPF